MDLKSFMNKHNIRVSIHGNLCVNDITNNVIFPSKNKSECNTDLMFLSPKYCHFTLKKIKDNDDIKQFCDLLVDCEKSKLFVQSIYVMSTEEQAANNMYKIGVHTGDKKELLSFYRQDAYSPKLYHFSKVSDCNIIMPDILEELDQYIITDDAKDKLIWVHLSIEKIIQVINKNIADHNNQISVEYIKNADGKVFNITKLPDIYKTLKKNYIVYEDYVINIIIDNDGMIWFCIKDALLALGYKDYRDVIKHKIDRRFAKQKQNINCNGITGQPTTLYMRESELYRIITKSNLPKAKSFSEWIFGSVINDIRNFNSYKLKTTP